MHKIDELNGRLVFVFDSKFIKKLIELCDGNMTFIDALNFVGILKEKRMNDVE